MTEAPQTSAWKAKEEQPFETGAGFDVKGLSTLEDASDSDHRQDLGVPGEFPFTRDPYPGVYRERGWRIDGNR